MTIPQLNTDDLEQLKRVFPDLNFDDAQRQAVLLTAATVDINAAPGSGKTSILAAKLYLLARRWTHARRGVCVISHTNVAREEIQRRLMMTPEGSRLLAYPHFVGTIHGFVNQFLALPWLRSKGFSVDIIDDNAFAKQALELANTYPSLRIWMEKDSAVAKLVTSLQYEGPDLVLSAGKIKLPGTGSQSLPHLKKIKQTLSRRGVFRFEDMFAFAQRLLHSSPTLCQRLSYRFPLILIDEMQDTSWAQEALLGKIFDSSVVMQRYGDINQQILSSDAGSKNLTFPRDGFLNISTSKRFSASIARAVSAVQIGGGVQVVGERPETVHRPTLLLYTNGTVEQVIPYFGKLVLNAFTNEEISHGQVKALCTRKKADTKEAPGRHLGDYWPSFLSEVAFSSAGADSAWILLADVKATIGVPFNLNIRAAKVRRVIFLALRAAESVHVQGVRDGTQLFRDLQRAGLDTSALLRVCRDLAVSKGLTASQERWNAVSLALYTASLPFLPEGTSADTYTGLNTFAKPEGDSLPPEVFARECVVEHAGRKVCVSIGTVASMKGETHLASLVLESHGGHSKKFDLKAALPALCGAEPINPKASKLLKGQFRNLYVAMSRPSHYLCVAMNAERAALEQVTRLEANGWRVEKLT